MAQGTISVTKHHFNPTILRAYDIRGIVGETLHERDAYMIGFGFAASLRDRGGKKVAIGRDGRLSSPQMATSLGQGLVDGGMQVIDIGEGPTPKLYFADIYFKTDGAIQVTGSHNPPDHNGFKMVVDHKPFFGDDITTLGQNVEKGLTSGEGGTITEQDVHTEYLSALLKSFHEDPAIAKGLEGHHFIWDCGNGAAGPTVLDVTAELPGTHHVLFPEVDGTFPNHHPDPVDPETLDLLREAVAKHKAIIGIGFDGDGDRIGLIDAKGRQIPGDLLTAYLSRHSLRRQKGASVIFDVKSSIAALDAVSAMGGKPSLWKTGHSHMKMKLKTTKAPLAGEMSGHIFIADGYYGFDDAIYAALAVLREMVASGESIADFIDSLPDVYATPELRIACPEDIKFATVDRVIADVESNPDDDMIEIADMDGIRVTGESGWWLIRASNTGAELVARAEGRDEKARDNLKSRIKKRLNRAGLVWAE
jgi:phosphomannomutase